MYQMPVRDLRNYSIVSVLNLNMLLCCLLYVALLIMLSGLVQSRIYPGILALKALNIFYVNHGHQRYVFKLKYT